MPLSKTQKVMLEYLVEYIGEHGYSPTYAEIAKQFGYRSLSTVHEHVRALADKGLLRVKYRQSRSIEVLRMDNRERRLPPVIPPQHWLRERVDDFPTSPVPDQVGLPSSFLRRSREAWQTIRALAGSGDEIWTFSTPREIWRESAGRAGYAIVRGGKVIDGVLVWDQIREGAHRAEQG